MISDNDTLFESENEETIPEEDDSVYLPIKPIYRRVKGYIPSVNEKNREKYSYFLCNTEKVMTRYKLYQIDVESNECKIIGKGMGRYNLRLGCMEAHDMFYNGSISFMDEFEIIVNDQKKNMIGTEVIFKSKKEDFDLRKNMSTDICISDDGMFLIMCPCLTYDNNRPELYLLDWDWKTEIRTEKMLPVELHYDIKEYKKFVKKHLHVSFLKNKKVSFYLK